jgi:hypothetical protein
VLPSTAMISRVSASRGSAALIHSIFRLLFPNPKGNRMIIPGDARNENRRGGFLRRENFKP